MVAKKRKRELEERTASRGQHESYESAIERSPTAEREAEADGAGAPDGIGSERSNIKGSYRVTAKNFNQVLPVVKVGEEDTIEENMVCTICFEEYSERKEYRITPCKHYFHYECIYTWLITNRKKKCPNDNFWFK